MVYKPLPTGGLVGLAADVEELLRECADLYCLYRAAFANPIADVLALDLGADAWMRVHMPIQSGEDKLVPPPG